MPLAFGMAVGFKSRLLDKPAALTRTGTAMAAMKPESNGIGSAFTIRQCSSLTWRTIESWRLPLC